MKNIFFITTILFSVSLYAVSQTEEKSIMLNAQIIKIALIQKNTYRLELKEFAAVYYAEEKFISCLQQSLRKKKQATLKVAAYSLSVQECHID